MMEELKPKKALRGGAFLLHSPDSSQTFAPEEANEDQRMMRESVRAFVVKEVQKRGDRLEEQVPLMKASAEMGLLGAHIPEEYGGLELDANTIAIIYDELGRGGGSFDTTFAAHTGIGMLPILYFGTDEQKARYIPKMCQAQIKASYCLTEPGSGSDALSAKSKAILSKDGTHYLLNGQKMWITNAGFADLFIVFAKIDGKDFTAFIVDAASEGISLGPEEDKMGIKGSSTRQVFFEDVKVPVENILGQQGKGHVIAFNILNIGRFKLGNLCLGGCKRAIETSIRYALERIQFEQPIAQFGAIKEKIGRQIMYTFALESAVYRVSDLLKSFKKELMEDGKTYAEALRRSAEEYAIECAIVKIYGSETLDFVVDELVQIHGGYGYSEDYLPSKTYRDARINRIYEGTNEINRLLIIDLLFKRAMRGKLDLMSAVLEVKKTLEQPPQEPSGSSILEAERSAVQNFKKMTLMVAGTAARYQMAGKIDLEESQEIVMKLADMLTFTFISESTYLRVEKLMHQMPKSTDTTAMQIVLEFLVYEMQREVFSLGKYALDSFVDRDEAGHLQEGLKGLSTYPDLQPVKKSRKIAEHGYSRRTYPF